MNWVRWWVGCLRSGVSFLGGGAFSSMGGTSARLLCFGFSSGGRGISVRRLCWGFSLGLDVVPRGRLLDASCTNAKSRKTAY